MSVSGFVQAGGQSRRMGRNKALLALGAHTLIEHALERLAPFVSQLAIITNTPEIYQHLAVESYQDIIGAGPLSGIHSALVHARNDYAVVLACDMPFVSAALIELLLGERAGYQLVMPQTAAGRLQPLCAIYHRSCVPAIERLIARGQYAPRALIGETRARVVPPEALAALGDAEHLLDNINTPEDLERARRYFSA